jgi:pimeloyl-ACP methyl ester carboxylesterase
MRVAVLVLVALVVVAPAHTTAQGTPPDPPYPPPGRLVDVGGWKVHLNCTGAIVPSRPTVVLEAGIGDFSVEWSLVQPELSKSARVCSYDRAGDGWSELGPYPRTMRQIAYELHTLLANAGERPPFLLVGHSYGGVLVRQYQATYPSEVAGLVLIEAGVDDPVRILPDGKLGHASDLPADKPIPAVKTSNPLRESDIPPGALAQMKAGLDKASSGANEPPRNKLPTEAQRMRTWALGQVKHVAAAVNPFETEELALLRAARMKSGTPLGDLPLVVVTRGLPDESGADARALEEEHKREHAAIAALSRRGQQIVATHSGHHVQIDEPALVVSTIHSVLSAVSGSTEVARRAAR